VRPAILRMLGFLALMLAALIYVAPLVIMVVGSLKPDAQVLTEAGTARALFPTQASLENYRDVFERVSFGRYLFNSVWITFWVVAAGLLVNSLAGYSLARLAWPGRRVVLTAVLAIMIIPLETIAIPLFYQVVQIGWRDDYLVQILPFVANAFSIYLFYVFFRALPPSLEQAAQLDGAGPWRTYFLIIAPNAKPAFASVAVLTFLMQWGNYLWPLLVTTGERVRPLPLAIASFYTLPPLQWGDIFAFGVMMVAPVLLVFVLFQGWFVRGVASAGIKG
jgi:multiple sugar transport system permease protein